MCVNVCVCMTRGTYAKWYPQKSCGPEQGLREKHKERKKKKKKQRDGVDAESKTDQHRENK